MMGDERPDKSSNLHRLIIKTAKAVREKGKPFEILLKTKQDSNEMFDFLNVGQKYHQFYSFLVSADEKTFFEMTCMDKPCSNDDDNADALAILTNTYKDEDDTEGIQPLSAPTIDETSEDLQVVQQNARLNKAREFINDATSKKHYRIEDYPDNSLRKKIKQYLENMVT